MDDAFVVAESDPVQTAENRATLEGENDRADQRIKQKDPEKEELGQNEEIRTERVGNQLPPGRLNRVGYGRVALSLDGRGTTRQNLLRNDRCGGGFARCESSPAKRSQTLALRETIVDDLSGGVERIFGGFLAAEGCDRFGIQDRPVVEWHRREQCVVLLRLRESRNQAVDRRTDRHRSGSGTAMKAWQ